MIITEKLCLEYKNIIEGCLYSIHDAKRGWDERPFIDTVQIAPTL